MTVSNVYSEQLDLISLTAELSMEFSTSSVNLLRKESSDVETFWMELTLVMLLHVGRTYREKLFNDSYAFLRSSRSRTSSRSWFWSMISCCSSNTDSVIFW